MQTEQYLVFDIETSPLPFDTFSESQQEYWLRGTSTDQEKEKKLNEMGLTPLTASVVCIGLQLMQGNFESGWEMINRAAFSSQINIGSETKCETLETGSHCYISDEQKLLNDFWKILIKYRDAELVSFNGRNFDAPFLMLRSALLGIKPSRNLMSGTKFNYSKHTDLLDELTFYMPQQSGATRRFNFDFYTRAFGIKSPKSEGVDGSHVSKLYNENRVIEIAEYCLRDVTATWNLFLKWKEFLKF
ncbi:MAG: ribonuclease H-like domain-containing protein [Candidatus Kapabacteria bacterium]|nr:ribonuclease H-like domain-containing protein [Candidatus Kapabacteria bacterium]